MKAIQKNLTDQHLSTTSLSSLAVHLYYKFPHSTHRLKPSLSFRSIFQKKYPVQTHKKMDNLYDTQTISGQVDANDGSVIESSAAMTMTSPPAEQGIPPVDDGIWNWLAEAQDEDFCLDFPIVEKSPEFYENAPQLLQRIDDQQGASSKLEHGAKLDEPKHDKLSPELRSLILWQSENDALKGKSPVQAPAMPDDEVTITNPPVAGERERENKKMKAIEVDVDDNYMNNFRRRLGGSNGSFPGRKGSINDNVMALQVLVPGSQKADLATTLGETVEHVWKVTTENKQLKAELKRVKYVVHQMQQSLASFMQNSYGMPSNMQGGHAQLGGLGFRPPVQPTIYPFNSPIYNARMNMPLLSQQNSAAAAQRLFVPPQVPAPSHQQQRIFQEQVLQNELFALHEKVMKDVFTQGNVAGTGNTENPF